MGSVSDAYYARVSAGDIEEDHAQVVVLSLLDSLLDAVQAPVKKSLFRKMPPPPKGLYLWGGVGTGKSFLMDLCVAHLGESARRIHFHAFMQEVHEALHRARQANERDALQVVSSKIAKNLRLLALDEMQIKDIADAMVVGRLFELLHAKGVTTLTTSNRPPDDLYKDGLNRQLFLPFIAFLKENLVIHDMQSSIDFRQQRLLGDQVYFAPNDETARTRMDEIWAELSQQQESVFTLMVKSRELKIPRYFNGIGRFSFADLCAQPLGAGDYLALADYLRIFFIDDIPQLGRHNFNEAKRFVTLIDTLYEAKSRLICSAACAPEALYPDGEGAFEFQRTASRLREMQSQGWGVE